MDNRKTLILDALRAFLRQRPDLASLGYDSVAIWRSESRKVTRDKNDALELIRAVDLSSITADAILKEAGSGGRLTINVTTAIVGARDAIFVNIDYCAGQSYGHEFRAAVARLMASCLWSYVREECMPAPCNANGEDWLYPDHKSSTVVPAGDWLRAHFRQQFGKRIQLRWFE